MSNAVHGRRWSVGVLAALAGVAAFTAAPAYAGSGTSATCVNHFTSWSTPGYFVVPSSGTETTNGETGRIDCVGTIAGERVTGPGTVGFELAYTNSTCNYATGAGTFSATIPTTGGPQHLVGALTESSILALNHNVDVRFPGMRYRGLGVIVPTQGTCFLTPMRKALIALTGTLTDA